jgi:Leucine-rich repeat (LRR) protein
MPSPDPTSEKPPRPKRWVPLSLRIFIAILVLISAAALWISVGAYRQHAALAEIKRVGGRVRTHLDVPEWLWYRLGEERDAFAEVYEVNLVGTSATDATLRYVGRLKGLERLLLDGTSVTDAGIVHLQRLPDLRKLTLNDTHLTDAGLSHLSGLTRLDQLRLGGTQVTDAGLPRLGEMSTLTHLELDGTRITDSGLPELKKLVALKYLSLQRTRVTTSGIDTLKQALPNTIITFSSVLGSAERSQ